MVETKRGDDRGRDIDRRVERKKDVHHRDQLLATVSYGICCTKCCVALLHWDGVWRKSEIINHTERARERN